MENGPLRVAINKSKNKVHLIKTTDRAVACVWRYKKSNGCILPHKTKFQEATNTATMKCDHCFRYFHFPSDWWKTHTPSAGSAAAPATPPIGYDTEASESGMPDTSVDM